MVQITGKYVVQTNENFVEYLKAIGIPEEKAAKGNDFAKDLEVTANGNKYVLKSEAGETTFTLNEEYEDKLPGGAVLKNVASLEGSKLVIKSQKSDGSSGERIYEFNDNGLTLTLTTSVSSVVGKRTYKRV